MALQVRKAFVNRMPPLVFCATWVQWVSTVPCGTKERKPIATNEALLNSEILVLAQQSTMVVF